MGTHWEQLCIPGTSAHPSGGDPCSAYPGTEYYYVDLETGELRGPTPVERDVDSPGLTLPPPHQPPAAAADVRYVGPPGHRHGQLYLHFSDRRRKPILLSRCRPDFCWQDGSDAGHVVWFEGSRFYSYSLHRPHRVLRWDFPGGERACHPHPSAFHCDALATTAGIVIGFGRPTALLWAPWPQP